MMMRPEQLKNSVSLSPRVSAARRMMASVSPHAFAEVYLPHYFTHAPSKMHVEIFETLREATYKRGCRIVRAAPRGHAKSTIVALAYVLWCALYKHEENIYLVSATKEQAEQLLKHVKDELQDNWRLLADFPEACQTPGSKPTPKPWRSNNILLRNGVLIRAIGSGQSLRGMRQRQHRPGLIVIDDVENKEDCLMPEQRAKMLDWFLSTLLKAGDERTNIVVIGTVLHYDSLLANLTNQTPASSRLGPPLSVGWNNKVYRAMEAQSSNQPLWEEWEQIYIGNKEYGGRSGPQAAELFYKAHEVAMLEGTRVLWPEKESYLQLMQLRVNEGYASFQSEKQNEPHDPETCIFSEGKFSYWDDEHEDGQALLAKLGESAKFYGSCDPSLGNRVNRGDYSAIITIVKDRKTGIMYVLDADIQRRTPEQIINRIVALAKIYKYRWFGVEGNQFQQILLDQLKQRVREQRVTLDAKSVSNTSNKQARIESLEPLINSGRLKFSRRHTMLIEQLRHFPLGVHDDGPDALEMAAAEAQKPNPVNVTGYV